MEANGQDIKTGDEGQVNQVHFVWMIALVAYSLSYLTFSLWLLVDLWVGDKRNIATLLSINPNTIQNNLTFVMALYTVTGALLGCAVLDFVSYHKYWAVKKDFQISHILGYFYGPWLAGTIGLIIFCLLQSGLFIFSGGATQGLNISETDVGRMGYISVGFLSGFGWMKAVEKIHEAVARFFATEQQRKGETRQAEGEGEVVVGLDESKKEQKPA